MLRNPNHGSLFFCVLHGSERAPSCSIHLGVFIWSTLEFQKLLEFQNECYTVSMILSVCACVCVCACMCAELFSVKGLEKFEDNAYFLTACLPVDTCCVLKGKHLKKKLGAGGNRKTLLLTSSCPDKAYELNSESSQ